MRLARPLAILAAGGGIYAWRKGWIAKLQDPAYREQIANRVKVGIERAKSALRYRLDGYKGHANERGLLR